MPVKNAIGRTDTIMEPVIQALVANLAARCKWFFGATDVQGQEEAGHTIIIRIRYPTIRKVVAESISTLPEPYRRLRVDIA